MKIRIRKIDDPLAAWEFPTLMILTGPATSAPVVIEQWDEYVGAWLRVEIVT